MRWSACIIRKTTSTEGVPCTMTTRSARTGGCPPCSACRSPADCRAGTQRAHLSDVQLRLRQCGGGGTQVRWRGAGQYLLPLHQSHGAYFRASPGRAGGRRALRGHGFGHVGDSLHGAGAAVRRRRDRRLPFLFGSTVSLFDKYLGKLGITTRYVELSNLEDWEAALTPATKLLFAETLPTRCPKWSISAPWPRLPTGMTPGSPSTTAF